MSRRAVRLRAAFGAAIAAGSIILLALLRSELRLADWSLVAPAVMAVVAMGILILAWTGSRLWSITGGVALVLGVFHFGLVALIATGTTTFIELPWITEYWLDSPNGREAAVIAAIGWLGYVLGVVVYRIAGRPAGQLMMETPREAGQRKAATLVGATAVVVGAVLWLWVLGQSGGFQVAFASYGRYLDSTSSYGALLGLIWMCVGLGLVFLASGTEGWIRRSELAAFGAIAIVALPLGLRGEIMFPLVAAATVLWRRGWRPRRSLSVLILAGALVLIPAVRVIRSLGVREVSSTNFESQPVWSGLAELGASLRPVYHVISWDRAGEPTLYGATYWAPFERGFLGVLPIVERLPAESDVRLFNVVVADRVGPIGGSVIAEAYYNGRLLGTLLVLATIGALLSWLEWRPPTARWDLVAGVILIPVLLHIRNSFVPVPFQLLLGIVLFIAVLILARARPAGHGARIVTSPGSHTA